MFRNLVKVLFVIGLVLIVAPALHVSAQGVDEGAAVVGDLSKIVYGLIGALIGGASVMAAILISVRSVLASPVIIKALEGLAGSFPSETKELINMLGKLLTEISDGVPVDQKAVIKAPPGLEG